MTTASSTERRRLWTSGAAASISVATNFLSSAAVSGLAFRQIGPELLGSWALMWSTLGLGVVLLLGLPTLITPTIARYRDEGNDAQVHDLFVTTHAMVLVIATGWLVVSYLASDLLLHLVSLRSTAPHRTVLAVAAAGVFSTQMSAFYAGALDGCGRMRQRAVLNTLSVVVYVLTALWLVPSHKLLGLALAFLAQALVAMVSMRVALYACMEKGTARKSGSILTLDLRELIVQGASLQFVGLLVGAVEWGSKVLIGQVGSLAVVSYFDLALKVVVQLRNVLLAGAQITLVEFAKRRHALGESDLFLNSTLVFMGLAAPFFVLLLLAAPLISNLLIGHTEPAFIGALRCITLGLIPQLVCAPAYFALIAQRRMTWVLYSHVVMLAIVLGVALATHTWIAIVVAYAIAYLATIPMLIWGVRVERLVDASAFRLLRWAFVLGGFPWFAGLMYSRPGFETISTPLPMAVMCVLCLLFMAWLMRLAHMSSLSGESTRPPHGLYGEKDP